MIRLLSIIMLIGILGCSRGIVFRTGYLTSYGPWHDGSYHTVQDLPTPQLLVVEVDIAGGQIVAIRVPQHPAWKAPQEQEMLLRQVLTQQTTEIEAPRQDGSEQDLLLHAIEEALSKARREPPSAP